MIPPDLGKKYFPNKYYRRPLRQKRSEVNQIIRDIQRPTAAYIFLAAYAKNSRSSA
jgi:hypothetical protein